MFWHNTALATFAVLAISLTWSVMNSGFSSSDKVKEIVEEAVQDSVNNLQVIGKVTGSADIHNGTIKVTSTPMVAANGGIVDLRAQKIDIVYKIVKVGSHEISYDDIYVGMLEGSYSSLKSALEAAKEKGLIKTNPNEDAERPDTTSAFLYFVINQNNDVFLENDEIANLVVIYADKDRPTTGEFIRLQIVESEGILLDMQRNIPNISGEVVDLGGKVKNQD